MRKKGGGVVKKELSSMSLSWLGGISFSGGINKQNGEFNRILVHLFHDFPGFLFCLTINYSL